MRDQRSGGTPPDGPPDNFVVVTYGAGKQVKNESTNIDIKWKIEDIVSHYNEFYESSLQRRHGKTKMIALYLTLIAWTLHSARCAEDVMVREHLPKPVIGVYFDKNSSMQDAFSLAVHTMNRCMYDYTICETMDPSEAEVNLLLYHQVEFTAVTIPTDGADVPTASKHFKRLTGASTGARDSTAIDNENGLTLVMGPHGSVVSLYVQGLCEIHDIPHLVIRRESEAEHSPQQTINLYPNVDTLADVYLEFVKVLNWTNFCILYENTANFVSLHNVLKMYPPYTFGVYGIRLGGGPNYTEPLLEAKKMVHKTFLIDCSFEILNDVLMQMQEVGMMTDDYRYVITTLDMNAIDWYQYHYSGVNIKGLQLVDVHNPFVRDFVGRHLDDFGITSVEQLRVKDALMFDSVALFAQAYKDLNYQNQMFGGATFKDYMYDVPTTWRSGLDLRNYLLYTEVNGLTGPVMIDGDGVRRRFKLDVVNLQNTGLQLAGEWNFEDGFSDLQLEVPSDLPHYKVLITLVAPYAVEVNHSRSMEGNARYEGFVVDIIEELAREMQFTYTIYVEPGKNNGNCESTKVHDDYICKCTGMMEKIRTHEVDMAITDLTQTESRARCVQFSTSFMNLGITILAKKPQKVPSWYSFLTPFDYRVWLYLGLSVILVPMLMVALARLCPAEWTNPYPCIDEPEELHNQFTFNNAAWFIIGTLLQQGSEIAPLGPSTRILAGSWYFFCLIMVNTYIANLAAFLTIEKPVKLLNGIDDLFNQNKIKFGAKINGSTYSYFKSSEKYYPLYEKMSDPEWQKEYMVAENEDGVQMAKRNDTDYVFFMESSSIDYEVKRNCELEKVGDLIDHKIYAIAYAKNFTPHHEISRTMSLLEEKSVLNDLRKKWWDSKGAVCPENDEKAPTEPLTEEQLRGVFIVLGVGLLMSTIATGYASGRGIRSMAKAEELGFYQTAKLEMKYLTSKPVKPVLAKQRSTETNLTDKSWSLA